MGGAVDVSVVMPCFNAAAYIEEALTSVLSQQGPTLEVIVVDDGSTDDSVAVAQRLGVRVIRQANRGPAAARNLGIQAARGRFVAFLDADDVWLPGMLAQRLACFDAEPDLGLVYGGFEFWRPQAEAAQQFEAAPTRHAEAQAAAVASGWLYPEILLDSVVCTITVVARREVFERVGGFDEALRTGEDYDLWIRIAQQYRCRRVDAMVARYRLHEGGTTRVPRDENNEYRVVRRALQRFGDVGARQVPLNRRQLAYRLYDLCFDHGYLHFWRGRAGIARRAFAQAIAHQPLRPKAWAYWLLSAFRSVGG